MNTFRMMEGGDLKTRNRPYTKIRGGDLSTSNRQYGGFLGLMRMFGMGASPAELQKAMSDPIKQQMVMQRGGFPWALAGLSLLPMLMGKGSGDKITNQMKATPPERHTPAMIRGGLAIPPSLLGAATKMAPYAKNAAIPFALGALSSLGDNIVDSIFGAGMVNGNVAHPSDDVRNEYRVEYTPTRNRGKKTRGGAAKSRRTARLKKTRVGQRKTRPKGKARTVQRTRRTRKPTRVRRTGATSLKNMFLDAAKSTGKRALRRVQTRAKAKVKSALTHTPVTLPQDGSRFHQRVDDSISQVLRAATTTPSSAHIGQSFNI